jgi:hypothetical protein
MVDGFTGRLVAFSHGELDPREHEEMRQHVDGCEDCTRRLAADAARGRLAAGPAGAARLHHDQGPRGRRGGSGPGT